RVAGEHEHGGIGVLLADGAQHVEPGAVGEAQVEEHEVRLLPQVGSDAGGAVAGARDGPAATREETADDVNDLDVVVDEEDRAHGCRCGGASNAGPAPRDAGAGVDGRAGPGRSSPADAPRCTGVEPSQWFAAVRRPLRPPRTAAYSSCHGGS